MKQQGAGVKRAKRACRNNCLLQFRDKKKKNSKILNTYQEVHVEISDFRVVCILYYCCTSCTVMEFLKEKQT